MPLAACDASQENIAWAADYNVCGEATLRAVPRTATGTDRVSGERRRGHGPVMDVHEGGGERAHPTLPAIIEQPFRFQGQQFDEETGLHYNRLRYYDPVVGRFASQDPIGLVGSTNLFEYTINPLSWIDPYGLSQNCPPKKEVIIEAGSFEEARNIALMKMGSIDPSSRLPQIGRLGAGKGRRTGFTGTGNGEFKRLRLDYDPDKGPHINVEVGKGECARKWAIKFPGTEETFKSLLKKNT